MSTLLKIAAFVFYGLPESVALRIGSALGAFWFYVLRIRRNTVFSNLQTALPNRKADHKRIAEATFRHFGITAVEFLRMSRMSRQDIAEQVDVDGMEHFSAALAKNKGVIVVTAHFGNFDLLAASQAARGIPIAVVSRNLHQNSTNRFWMESRKNSGLEIFEDKGAAKKILKHLKNNKVVALTVDQRTRADRGGVLMPFMGQPAMTATAPALLAAAAGSPIVPVRIERRPNGRHLAVVEPEIPPPPPRNRPAAVAVTKKVNVLVSTWITSRPEQYMWLHRRFIIENDYTGLSPNQ